MGKWEDFSSAISCSNSFPFPPRIHTYPSLKWPLSSPFLFLPDNELSPSPPSPLATLVAICLPSLHPSSLPNTSTLDFWPLLFHFLPSPLSLIFFRLSSQTCVLRFLPSPHSLRFLFSLFFFMDSLLSFCSWSSSYYSFFF